MVGCLCAVAHFSSAKNKEIMLRLATLLGHVNLLGKYFMK